MSGQKKNYVIYKNQDLPQVQVLHALFYESLESARTGDDLENLIELPEPKGAHQISFYLVLF